MPGESKKPRLRGPQPGNNFFQNLPSELTQYIADAYLKLENVAALRQTYTGMHHFFSEHMKRAKANRILEFVAQGNQDAAQKLIEENPELLTVRTKITDWTDRTFESISPWEYSLWALDTRHMAKMMLACIPSNERGKLIRDELLAQYTSLEENGVTYEFNGRIINESHFSFEPLLTTLQTFVDEFDRYDYEFRKYYWITVVGWVQRHLVVHARQHYCGPRPVSLTPNFDECELTRCLEFYHYDGLQILHPHGPRYWDLSASSDTAGLGFEFAIRTGQLFEGRLGPAVYDSCPHWSCKSALEFDLKSIGALSTARMDDFILLKEKLENLLEYECESTIPNNSV